jgi:hypothetical protein
LTIDPRKPTKTEGRPRNTGLLLALILLLSGCGSTGPSSHEQTTAEEGPTTVLEVASTEETVQATTETSEGATVPKQDDEDDRGMSNAVVTVAGVLEKPGITTYMYGTHAITDEASGTSYALRSEDQGLLDGYVGQRVTVYGTVVPGYENGQIEGGPPLLNVIRVEPAR